MLETQSFIKTGVYSIDNHQYNIQELTCAQLSVHYSTGRAYVISGTGRDRKYGFRAGKMTNIGDVLEEDWITLARYIIERDSEQDIFTGLVEYAKTCAWLHSNKEREEYALDLHMRRIFENPEWVGYEAFTAKYRHVLCTQK